MCHSTLLNPIWLVEKHFRLNGKLLTFIPFDHIAYTITIDSVNSSIFFGSCAHIIHVLLIDYGKWFVCKCDNIVFYNADFHLHKMYYLFWNGKLTRFKYCPIETNGYAIRACTLWSSITFTVHNTYAYASINSKSE